MSYRALWTGDLHASNSLPYAAKGAQLVTDRLLDVVSVLDAMVSHAKQHDISDIWILGDLLDRRLLDAITLKLVMERLDVMLARDIHVRLLPGNHEAYDASCHHYTVEAFQSIGVEVFSEPSIIDVKDGPRFLAVPYLPEARAIEAFNDFEGKKEETVLLLHQTIRGGKIGDWAISEGIDPALLKQYHTTLSGHFHTPQKVVSGVHYLGAPLQHNFGDMGESRGFWDILFGDKIATAMEKVATDTPAFFETDWPLSAEIKDQLKANPGCYFRVKVRGTPAALKKLVPEAEAECQRLLHEGARMAKVEPIMEAEAKTRLAVSEGGARSWPKLVDGYIDVCDVSGLAMERLRALGAELLSEAEG